MDGNDSEFIIRDTDSFVFTEKDSKEIWEQLFKKWKTVFDYDPQTGEFTKKAMLIEPFPPYDDKIKKS